MGIILVSKEYTWIWILNVCTNVWSPDSKCLLLFLWRHFHIYRNFNLQVIIAYSNRWGCPLVYCRILPWEIDLWSNNLQPFAVTVVKPRWSNPMQGLVASFIFRKLRVCFDKNEKDRDNTTLFLVREASALLFTSRIDQTSVQMLWIKLVMNFWLILKKRLWRASE